METELPVRFKKLPSLKISRNCSSSQIDEDRRSYTSLKDILLSSPPTSHAINVQEGGYDFDSSNIAIKNKLVKRAASAYVQSAAILAVRNQSYFVSLWGRIKNIAYSCSCWNLYVRDPLHACFNPIYRFLASTAGAFWNTMTRIS